VHGPKQDGTAAIEFAFVSFAFFLIVFGIIEIARLMYMYNTLPEVTRRVADAAANISFNDASALDLARKRGIFNETSGAMPFGSPVTYENVRIEYLYLPAGASELTLIPKGSMPSCPAKNKLNCMNNPNGASCIRAIQVRICAEGMTGNTCTPVAYQPIVSLIYLPVDLPQALTIVNAETLGYKTGDIPCP
jgi:cbb3-type cytochrome oxidase subunit 3